MTKQSFRVNTSSNVVFALAVAFMASPASAVPLVATGGEASSLISAKTLFPNPVIRISEHEECCEGEGEDPDGDGDGDGGSTGPKPPKPPLPVRRHSRPDDSGMFDEHNFNTRSQVVTDLQSGILPDAPTGTILGPGGVPLDPEAQLFEETASRMLAARALCGGIPTVYRIDCLADQFAQIAQNLPSTGELGELKAALTSAARELSTIARQNRDPAAARVRPVSNTIPGQPEASRALRAVRPERQAQAEQRALAVVDQLATVLLRSADNATRNSVYFARLAQAVDSNKILLRSA